MTLIEEQKQSFLNRCRQPDVVSSFALVFRFGRNPLSFVTTLGFCFARSERRSSMEGWAQLHTWRDGFAGATERSLKMSG
jgi:hypothetical protein